MNDFFQIMWRSDGYMNPGSYFRTLDEGIEFLKEDAKKREGQIYSPFLGELETRSFDRSKEPEVVAIQVKTGPRRLGVKVKQ